MLDHSDRVKRVQTALWIYANIAMGDLPALTNFWEKTSEMHPLMTKRLLYEHLRTDKDGLNKGLDKAAQPIWKDWKRAKLIVSHVERNYREEDKSVYPGEENKELTPEEIQQENKALRDFYTPGYLKKITAQYDEQLTGGLFTADTKEKQVRAAATRFRYFSSINWSSCFSASDEDLSRIAFVAFFQIVMGRYTDIQHFKVFQQALQEYNEKSPEHPASFSEVIQVLTQSADVSLSEGEEDGPEKGNGGWFYKNLGSILSGRRWSEIADLLGAREIIFIGGVHDEVTLKESHTELNIPMIIEKGSNEEYDKLKRLLREEFGWLGAICSQLRGVLPMILEAESLRTSDRPRTLTLAKEIQEKCIETLGTSNIRDDVWMSPTSSIESRAFSIITLTLDISAGEVPPTSTRDDERALFLEIFTRSFIESPTVDVTERDTMTLAHIEQILVQAKEKFLSKYDERLQQHRSCSSEAKGEMLARKVLLTQAIDSLSKLVLTTLALKSNQHGEVTETEREEDIEYSTRECTKCAELFAFAMSYPS